MNDKSINHFVFYNKLKSYLVISFLGILAGLLVAFFDLFPYDDFWGLALFSHETIGFWIFTCSLITLFSSKNYIAGIHVGLYVYFMFYITGVYKCFALVNKGYQTMSYFYNGLWRNLTYGIYPAILCFVLAFVLWHARKNKTIFIVFRFLPLLFILVEIVLVFMKVVSIHQGFFMLLVDIVCAIVYALIVIKSIR